VWRGTGGVCPRAAPVQKSPEVFHHDRRGPYQLRPHGDHRPQRLSVGSVRFPTPNPILTHRNRSDSPIRLWVMPTWWKHPTVGGWSVWEPPPGRQVPSSGPRKHFWLRHWSEMAGPWSMATARWKQQTATAPASHPWKRTAGMNFTQPGLGAPRNFPRNPHVGDFSLTERPGWLTPQRSAVTLETTRIHRRLSAAARRTWRAALPPGSSFNPQHEKKKRGSSCAATRK